MTRVQKNNPLSKLETTIPHGKNLCLRDLAKMAKVDTSTVSRALRYDPRVSEKRGKHIRQLAEQLGYRPQPLRTKKAQAIGVLICSQSPLQIEDYFLQRIAWLAQQVLGEHRLHVNLECTPADPDCEIQIPALISENRVDGLLLAGDPPVELVKAISQMNVPMVAINDSPQRLGIDCVSSSPSGALDQCILRLAAYGHQQIALVLHSRKSVCDRARYDAYLNTTREIGLTLEEDWLVEGVSPNIAGGREAIQILASRGKIPSAILCLNDWVAMGALMELNNQGLAVPRDVSLVGHDDLPMCQHIEPQLTSIYRDERKIVQKAVNLLLDQIANGSHQAQDVKVQGKVVWRESSGLAPDRQL